MPTERGKNPKVTTPRRPAPPKADPEPDPAPPHAQAAAPASGEDGVPKDTYLRLAADFENFKKRARQEQMDTVQYANSALVERLLPVLDDFRRIVEHAPPDVDESWLRGVQLTLQKL